MPHNRCKSAIFGSKNLKGKHCRPCARVGLDGSPTSSYLGKYAYFGTLTADRKLLAAIAFGLPASSPDQIGTMILKAYYYSLCDDGMPRMDETPESSKTEAPLAVYQRLLAQNHDWLAY